MKLDIRLVNEKERALRDAELTIKLVFKDGKERTLPTRTSNIRGEVPIDDVDAAVFKQINFAKSQYQIRVGDTQTPWLKLGRPHKVSAKHFRYILMAKQLGNGDTQPSIDHGERTLNVQVNVHDQKQTPLSSVYLYGQYVDKAGVEHQVPKIKIEQSGEVVQWTSDRFPGEAKDRKSVRFYVDYNGKTYATKRNGPVAVKAEAYDYRLDLTVNVQSTGDSTNPAPQPDIEDDTDRDVVDTVSSPSDSKKFQVFGRILQANGQAAPNYHIVAYDRDICDESELGHVISSDDGAYDISYDNADFTDPEKASADLVVKVYKTKSRKDLLAISPLIINAGESQQVNLSVDSTPYKGKSLFEVVGNKVSPHVLRKSWDCIEAQDIALISNRTGLQHATVAQFCKANLLAENLTNEYQDKSDFSTHVLFALFRAGYRPSLPALFSKTDHLITAVLETAIEANEIPPFDVGAYIESSRPTRTKITVAASEQQSHTVFKLAKLKQAQIKTLTSHFISQQLKGVAWDTLATQPGFNDVKVNQLKSITLGAQLVGDMALLEQAQKQVKSLHPRQLAKLTSMQWAEIIKKQGIELPNTLPGKNNEERAQRYAEGIAKAVESQYPTNVFARDVVANKKMAKGEVQRIFAEYPEFDLETGSLAEHIIKVEGMSRIELEPLIQLENLYRIAPVFGKYKTVNALWQAGIKQAKGVTKLGKAQFRKQFSEQLGGNQQADKVFASAQGQVAVSLAKAAQSHAQINSISTNILPSIYSLVNNNAQLKSAYVQFYGPLSLINCEHCQSNLSPAAYLVDLLSFLEKASNNAGQNGRVLFNARRPEIERLEVSCVNTETLMPYIDLVLEVLENAVAPITPAADFAPQTTESAEWLAARPTQANINIAAYNNLENTNYPWNLPFHYETEHSRTFLAHGGVSRYQLLLALRKYDNDLALDAATEYLGLTPKQAGLVSAPLFGNAAKNLALAKLWGFNQLTDLIGANQVEKVMSRTGLTFEELKALFSSQFVNPNAVEHFNVNGTMQNLNAEILDPAHRMGRLYQLVDYSIESLDVMLGIARQGIAFIPELAAISYLEKEAGLSLTDIAEAWALPENERAARFATLFGVPDQDAEKLGELVVLPWNTPVTPMVIWEQLTLLSASDLSLADTYDLLTAPDAESAFSKENIESALESTIDALALLAQEEATEYISDSAPDTTVAVESTVQIDLVDESTIEVTENQAKRNELIVETLSSVLLLDANQVRNLLYLTSNTLPVSFEAIAAATDANVLINELTLFAKQVMLLDKLGLDARHYSDLIVVGNVDGVLSIDRLPVANESTKPISTIGLLVSLANTEINWGLSDRLLIGQLVDEEPDYADLAELIAEKSGWLIDDVNFMLGSDGFDWNTTQNYIEQHGWREMAKAMEYADVIGVDIKSLWSYKDSSSYQDIKATLQAKYAESDWLAVCAQLTDPLREKQRDALLGWLIHHGTGPLASLNTDLDVYNHFLLDPEMSACFDTSRIVQATGSVQQFIQRVLLNLEGDLTFPASEHKAWEWRKNYRVWEANRKVFLYPENWIEPELRHNKTELFEALESELLQGSLDSERAETALINYAKGLHDIANLEMCGFCEHTDNEVEPPVKTLYLFARTRGIPHQYYLAKQITKLTTQPSKVWTAWEKIDVDIQGDHLMPVFYNNRLHIFWLTLEENRDEEKHGVEEEESLVRLELYQGVHTYLEELLEQEQSKPEYIRLLSLKDSFQYLLETEKYFSGYLTAQLSWSVLENTIWKPTKLSELKLNATPMFNYGVNKAAVQSATRIQNNEIVVSVSYNSFKFNNLDESVQSLLELVVAGLYGSPDESALQATLDKFLNPKAEVKSYGNFYINSCDNNVSLTPNNDGLIGFQQLNKTSVLNARSDFLKWKLNGAKLAISELNSERIEEVQLLDSLQGQQGHVLFSSHNSGSAIGKPFIFEDAKTSYLVTKIHDAPGKPIVELPPPPVDRPEPPSGPSVPYPIPTDPRPPWDIDDIIIDIDDVGVIDEWSWGDIQESAPVFSGTINDGSVILSQGITGADFQVNRGHYTKASRGPNIAMFNKVAASVASSRFHDVLVHEALSNDEIDRLIDRYLPKQTYNNQEFLFEPLYHPYSCLYIKQLYKHGVDGLFQPEYESGKEDDEDLYQQKTPNSDYDFDALYEPTNSVVDDYPVEKIDFSFASPYGLFNNEMFFYAPMLVATRLMQNQKFEEARKWFHYIFDPTSTEGEGGARVWRYRIFADTHNRLVSGDITLFFGDTEKLSAQYEQWITHPFNPHAIAQTRVVAYMRYVIMRYLDNLLAWGDYLFRQDTRESINEATQLYVLAAQMLGPKPVVMDGVDTGPKATVSQILDDTANNTQFAFDESTIQSYTSDSDVPEFFSELLSFCVPQNDQFLGYWDTVSDRLFKIRHCMNIDGMVRSLALFQPPIDPALLVRAAAAGVSISSVVAGLSAVGRPLYRFNYMLARAHDFVSEVKSLGSTLLSTLEKQDAEALAAIRSTNELELLKLMEDQKKLAVDEAGENLTSEEKSLDRLAVTKAYYEGLLETPVLEAEKNQDRLDGVATLFNALASVTESLGAVLAHTPETTLTVGPASVTYGGSNMNNSTGAAASAFRAGAAIASFGSRLSGTFAGRTRREQEWQFQLDAVDKDIAQIEQRVVAAEVRVALAKQDLSTFKTQITQTKQADDFLRNKFTNTQLYAWLKNELSTLYFQAYQLAYDMAKKAEIAYRHELGEADTSFIGFGNWDSLHKGLLAGERLSLDLRRMEQSFIEQNKRDLELTKHISIAMLNPAALMELKNTGECDIELPEFIFDLDYPGQYNRRIKTVSLSIPCITGPYTNVSCTLSLMSSHIRRDVDERGEDGLEQLATLAGQHIATSSAQSDSGVFQLDFRDERYLPFEGEGAISTWKLKIAPPALAQFDYETISDVIMHMSYTAKYDESAVTTVSNEMVTEAQELAETIGRLPLLVDVPQMFPDAWHLFKNSAESENDTATISIQLDKQHFPFFVRNRLTTLETVEVFIEAHDDFINQTVKLLPIESTGVNLIADSDSGMLKAAILSEAQQGADNSIIITENTFDAWELSVPRSMVNAIKSIGIFIGYTI